MRRWRSADARRSLLVGLLPPRSRSSREVTISRSAARIGLWAPAATARWKRRSCRRKACGSSRLANIPATSWAMAAIWSPLARAAASAAVLHSRTRRASRRPSWPPAVQGREQAQRLAPEGRGGGDEGAGALLRTDDAHRGQGAQALADAGATDARLPGELALGRQAGAGTDLALFDEPTDERDRRRRGGRLAVGAVREPRSTGHRVRVASVSGPRESGGATVTITRRYRVRRGVPWSVTARMTCIVPVPGGMTRVVGTANQARG